MAEKCYHYQTTFTILQILTENAIEIIGESDGVFNNDDYILFYGEGARHLESTKAKPLIIYMTQNPITILLFKVMMEKEFPK